LSFTLFIGAVTVKLVVVIVVVAEVFVVFFFLFFAAYVHSTIGDEVEILTPSTVPFKITSLPEYVFGYLVLR
jgi:hypothetical protein